MNVKLEYYCNQYIEFERQDIHHILGSNYHVKDQLFQACQYFNKQQKIAIHEDELFGLDGINFYIDEKELTNKNSLIITIDSIYDLIDELSLKKGTTCYQYMKSKVSGEIVIGKQYEQLQNALFLLENIVSEQLLKDTFLSYHAKTYSLFDFLKLGEISLDSYDIKYGRYDRVIDAFIMMLSYLLEQQSRPIIIMMRHLNSFLSLDMEKKLIQQLKELGSKYQHLITLIINNGEQLFISQYESEQLLYINSFEMQQLPDFELIKKSVMLRYPIEYKKTDDELIRDLNYYLPQLSLEYIHHRVIIYEVLKGLLES